MNNLKSARHIREELRKQRIGNLNEVCDNLDKLYSRLEELHINDVEVWHYLIKAKVKLKDSIKYDN